MTPTIWLAQWAEYGRRKIYGPDAIGQRHERAQRQPARGALGEQDRITRRAWR
jgi:hypothetical protein